MSCSEYSAAWTYLKLYMSGDGKAVRSNASLPSNVGNEAKLVLRLIGGFSKLLKLTLDCPEVYRLLSPKVGQLALGALLAT
jgi:hypothetical protein